ncbi:MAG: sugar-binding domain-containing protein [Thermoguttaceae bacterium]
MKVCQKVLSAVCLLAQLALASMASADDIGASSGKHLRKIGGFLCVDLKPYKNDATFDLYKIGWWSYSGLSWDIWKRNGVPFWYPPDAGNVFVAGEKWTWPGRTVVSSTASGGIARTDHQQPGNGAIAFANDDDLTTYWYAGDNRPHGKLIVDLAKTERIASVRFHGFAGGRHAPKDYRVGLILPDGREKEIASVKDEKRMGQWISFNANGVEAKGIYLDVAATVENVHGPVIHEFQARIATPRPVAKRTNARCEVVVPLHGIGAEEMFVLGNVGRDFDKPSRAGATVGRYVITYENGEEEAIPLVVGKNVADMRYGHFASDAVPAFMMPDQYSVDDKAPVGLSFHLDEMLPVEPKKQLMMFAHKLRRPGKPLKGLAFRVTDPEAAMYLAALTLRQSGPRMNALFYNGKMVNPIPVGTPQAAPSILDRSRDPRKSIALDGRWLYRRDPAHEGTQAKYFTVDCDVSNWKTMPVPSQWYVQGIDYHGVVWFRRDVRVPADFPGAAADLCFDGVDYDARVWVNGQYIGRHVGAFSTFKLDASAAIKRGASNTIVVRVDSPLDPGFEYQKTLPKGQAMDDIAMPYLEEGCMGGIYRTVRLQSRGDVRIEEAWTQSNVSEDLKRANVKIQFVLCPQTPNAGEVSVKCSLKQPDGKRTHFVESQCTLSRKEKTPVELALAIDNPKLWYPWEQGQPYLYLMEIEVYRGKHLLDRHLSRVGIREVGFDAEKHCVSINHHRIFLKGFLNDDVHWMSLMDRSGYAQRLKMQRDAGANTIRLTTHQSSPEMYDLCNEMGIMIWQELPLQWAYSGAEPIHRQILQIARETMVQTRPHPCVIGYSAWNEGGQPEFTDRVVALMRSLDATRPLSRACGGGDWDIHIYTDMPSSLTRLTPLWIGHVCGFVSEIGSYGLPTAGDMHEILGPDLFPFDSADYYWESFCNYRHVCGPLYLDTPRAFDWPKEKVLKYVLGKQPAAERHLYLYVKSAFENFRGQRFAPSTALLYCRFDDPVPSSQLGLVSFNGRPRKAYFAAKEAMQTVLPILCFDMTGADGVRVINDYWHRSWRGCTLKYTLKNRDGSTIRHVRRTFDLPEDATVNVLARRDVGDVWRLPGFFAELQVFTADGTLLSENHYDMREEEIVAFVTNVYPVPPANPVGAIVLKGSDAVKLSGAYRQVEAKDAYSEKLLDLGNQGKPCAAEFEINLPHGGDYHIRMACDSGEVLQGFQLTADGVKASRESVPYLDMTSGITRRPYSDHNLSWRPGWQVSLAKGRHKIVLKRAEGSGASSLLLDAIAVQPATNMRLTAPVDTQNAVQPGAPGNGTGWPLERCSYWLDGALRLGYVLHDDALIKKVTDRLNLERNGK